jgi:hypothetical protein
MSRGSAKREMETATSHGKAPSRESDAKAREESPPRVKSHRSGDKKKKMKKVVYYKTDASSPSTSGSDSPSVTSKRHDHKKFSKIPLRYPHISKRTPLLSIPLGKPPVFYGEDYCMWSDKMRHHLTSLHTSIWDIVEFGAQVPSVGTKNMIGMRSLKSGTLIPKQPLYSSPLYSGQEKLFGKTPTRGPSGPLRRTIRGTKVTLGQEHCKNTSLHYGPCDGEASTVRPQARTVRSMKTRKTRR